MLHLRDTVTRIRHGEHGGSRHAIQSGKFRYGFVARPTRNIAVRIYRALLENQAGFYGSQMTAMDNATRNAGDMINRLSIQYNRQRQAVITTELIEIISGAEAL